jgi:hypothetical protein
MRATAAVILAAAVMFAFGCQGSQGPGSSGGGKSRLDALEGQVKKDAEQISRMQSELTALKSERYELKVLLAETRAAIEALRSGGVLPGEKAFKFAVTRVGFGFLTSAVSLARTKADDTVVAFAYLYDQYDSAVKRAGAFRFDLLDLARPEGQMVLQTWTFTPEAAAKFWVGFPGGYEFKLPLAESIRGGTRVLKMTFEEEGGKELVATREIKIERP